MKEFIADKLHVKIFDNRRTMGVAAAQDIASAVIGALDGKQEINMIFAAAPSQNEVLDALSTDTTIPWPRINAYHMDEYIGLPPDAPQRFGNFLRNRLFALVPFKTVHYMDPASSPAAAAKRYASLLANAHPDIVVMGIGENGHIAFNDPGVADFNDATLVKEVSLDKACRRQQVHDKCFTRLADVPKKALTLTIPALMSADKIFCVVPGAGKASAIAATIRGPVSVDCPASILRTRENVVLYLDADSASLI